MNKQHINQKNQKGFTLIEMSIVLVIIGLIVSGILVGQDLITNARVTSTVTQIREYDTALNVFRGKYGDLPGDLAAADSYITGATGSAICASGCVNGDGKIWSDTLTTSAAFTGEVGEAMAQLALAGMINGAYTIDTTFPDTKLKQGGITLGSAANGNLYWLVGTDDGVALSSPTVGVETAVAFQIDDKIDDGNAAAGTVMSVTSLTTGDTASRGSGATGCSTATTSPSIYEVAANTKTCLLSIRTSN